MPRLIDFSTIKDKIKYPTQKSCIDRDSGDNVSNNDVPAYDLIPILLQQKPGKFIYSLNEAAEILGIGQEFLRRRIKSGKIRSVSLGDKPAINIIELARILSEGV